jgi:UDP-N-acetylmuramate--alanine ligase
MKEQFANISHVHFIGIGGIGISAIARLMLSLGKEVSGSDIGLNKITEELMIEGVTIYPEQSASNILDTIDTVIYTIAITPDNLEFVEAKNRNIKIYSYPEILGILSKQYKTVAISGTHGKTTTTAMTAEILIEGGLKPAVIVGSLFKNPLTGKATNFIEGGSDILVVEACEYRRSYLNLSPHILVITNIDNDHLDYYKDINDIQSAFRELVMKMGNEDFVICNSEDLNVKPVIEGSKAKILDYTKVDNVFRLQIPGDHNISNAKAAFLVGECLGVSEEERTTALEAFKGTWRRFEYKGVMPSGALVYDDYGHHPSEIKATLAGARSMFPEKNIRVIFQPHLFSRTKLLFKDFVWAFKDADEVILAPIYAAREPFDSSINSEMLAHEIETTGTTSSWLSSLEEIQNFLKSHNGKEDVILTLGAGDVYKVAEAIVL